MVLAGLDDLLRRVNVFAQICCQLTRDPAVRDQSIRAVHVPLELRRSLSKCRGDTATGAQHPCPEEAGEKHHRSGDGGLLNRSGDNIAVTYICPNAIDLTGYLPLGKR